MGNCKSRLLYVTAPWVAADDTCRRRSKHVNVCLCFCGVVGAKR